MVTHSSILGCRIPWDDSLAGYTVCGVSEVRQVGYDLATKPLQERCQISISTHFLLIKEVSFTLSHLMNIIFLNREDEKYICNYLLSFAYLYVKNSKHFLTVLFLKLRVIFSSHMILLADYPFKNSYIISYQHYHFFDSNLITGMMSIFGNFTIWLCMKLPFFIIFINFQHCWVNSLRKAFYYLSLQTYIMIRM